jgi:hypothetical protein
VKEIKYFRIDAVINGMKEKRNNSTSEESNPLMANEPTVDYGTISRTGRRSKSHGTTGNIDMDMPEDLMSEEAFQYYHPEVELKSLSEMEIPVVSIKEMLKHGMSLEEFDAHLTRKIHSYYHTDK